MTFEAAPKQQSDPSTFEEEEESKADVAKPEPAQPTLERRDCICMKNEEAVVKESA